MKNVRLLLVLLVCMVGLLGCQSSDKENQASNTTVQNMSKEMPHDFDFFIAFGVNKRNVINTFDSTLTKDLIADGTATTDLYFTEEERKTVYNRMRDINITETKEFIPKPKKGTMCVQEPHEEDVWKIQLNDKTITHAISGKYCEPTQDAKELIALRKYVWGIVKSKPEYQALPPSNGGYE